MAYRDIELTPEVRDTFDDFVEDVRRRFEGDRGARVRACRELLAAIYYPGPRGYDQLLADPALPLPGRAALLQLDPDNVTLEHERYTDIDPEAYADIKPLVWFWIMFDRSVMGRNCHLGFRVRQVLAEGVFRRCGKRLKIFHDVEFTWGYRLEVGDDCTLHRGVFLDDRGGLTLGDSVSVSDYANVYTHSHDVDEISDVTCTPMAIGDGARLTYHSTLLAGTGVGADGMVAACALATKPVPAGWVWGGVPARALKAKNPDGGSPSGCC